MKLSGSLLSLLLASSGLVGAVPKRRADYIVKRQVSELHDVYDFVIAGGGTSGLTVADRLSEAFPQKTALVVEYGDIEYAPGTYDPPKIIWGETGGTASGWTLNSTPSPELNNQTALVRAGKVVGGSSAINGMVFDRGSRHDYDAWDQLQDKGAKEKWNWDAIYPFFKKSVTFTPPPAAVVKQYNYTWDTAAFGNSTPIYASYPPFQWGDHFAARNAWIDIGIEETKECAGGTKEGLCWMPCSEHPVTMKRSHSGLGHYANVVGTRSNYHLLVKHQVVRVIYPKNDPTSGPPTIEIRSLGTNKTSILTANAEVILSAGVFHSPSILQRSGIGPTPFLKTANIPLVIDLPGVGANLHDHSGPAVNWNYTTVQRFNNSEPLPSDMLNATFAAAAAAEFNNTPATGPYTLAMSNSGIWISLANMTTYPQSVALLSIIRELAAASSVSDLFLPPEYASSPSLIAGYQSQLLAIADLLENPHTPSLESAFATGTRIAACLLHPLSRGTVRLNLSSPLDIPIIDYRSASNPIDIALHLIHVRYLRRTIQSPTFKKLGAYEVLPGRGVESDEELIAYIRNQTVQSYMHPCCTSAMLPVTKGGVVGTDLKVHGAKGLRVVDMGIMPVLISAHLSATAYAVGEKAADIIIREWRGK